VVNLAGIDSNKYFLFVVQNLLFIGFFFQISPPKIFAHAPDSIIIKEFLVINPVKISFKRRYMVQPLHLESVWQAVDSDSNEVISEQELADFEGEFPEFELKVNDFSYSLEKNIYEIPEYQEFISGKNAYFSVGVESEAIKIESGANKLFFTIKTQNKSSTLEFLELETSKEISIEDKKVEPEEGLNLTINYSGAANLLDDAVKTATESLQSSEKADPFYYPCKDIVTPRPGLVSIEKPELSKKFNFARVLDFITANLEGSWLNLSVVFLAITVFGAVHALTPGHGKALTSAYLIGKEGRTKHIIFLGLTVTITHTLLVYFLGFVSLFLKKSQASLALSQAAEFGSAILVIIISLMMLVSKVKPILPHCFQHLLGIGHHHDHDHDHQGSHIHKKNDLSGAISLKELIALGISGGLVPCGDALLLMLLAVGVGKPLLGLALVFSFSLGMALTLIVLGFLIIKSKKLLVRLERFQTIQTALSFLSPIIILIIGIGLLLGLINSF